MSGTLHEQVELLEDHAHGAPGLAQLGIGLAAEVPALKKDAAARGAFQQVDAAHKGGLARTALADDAENVPFVDGKVNALQGEHFAFAGIFFFQADDIDDGLFSHDASTVMCRAAGAAQQGDGP